MNERFALVRNSLNLTTRKFGEKINVTGGAVTNMEKGKRNITDRVIADVCREFNVNEEWLRDGVGEMFIEEDEFSLDEYVKSKGATDLELDIIKSYFDMPKELRSGIEEYFKTKVLPKLRADNELACTEETRDSIEYEVAAYRQELEAESKGEILSVSEDSEGNYKTPKNRIS